MDIKTLVIRVRPYNNYNIDNRQQKQQQRQTAAKKEKE